LRLPPATGVSQIFIDACSILDTILERLSNPQHIEYVLRRVEAQVGKLYTHVPKSIHVKETELTAEERRLANFVDLIGEGRGSRTLAQALRESERKVAALKEELAACAVAVASISSSTVRVDPGTVNQAEGHPGAQLRTFRATS